MITLYGLKNCDTCRKARKWLAANEFAYRFHDIRGDGLTRQRIDRWVAQLGWQAVINHGDRTLYPLQTKGLSQPQPCIGAPLGAE